MPIKYGMINGIAGIETAKPAVVKGSGKKDDSIISKKARRLIKIYTLVAPLLNQPFSCRETEKKAVAKYVSATSTTEIIPN